MKSQQKRRKKKEKAVGIAESGDAADPCRNPDLSQKHTQMGRPGTMDMKLNLAWYSKAIVSLLDILQEEHIVYVGLIGLVRSWREYGVVGKKFRPRYEGQYWGLTGQ